MDIYSPKNLQSRILQIIDQISKGSLNKSINRIASFLDCTFVLGNIFIKHLILS